LKKEWPEARAVLRGAGSSDAPCRADCLARYREKKERRLYANTIRYMKRKINADRRPRVKGRFVKAEDRDSFAAGGS
jgi:CCT motif